MAKARKKMKTRKSARKAKTKSSRRKASPRKAKARKATKRKPARKRRPKGIAAQLASGVETVADSFEESAEMQRKMGTRVGIGEG